jgi:tRNA U38,U39,U40 pseudouridine synthase TruA
VAAASTCATALEARDRKACGPVAPPDGLYLMKVDYADRSTKLDLSRIDGPAEELRPDAGESAQARPC